MVTDVPSAQLFLNPRTAMRVSGGGARGIPLALPKGDLVRPATDQMRQAVFSSLGSAVVGASFVDLFAGGGGYGLEALSRGASGGTFVEKNARVVPYIKQNLEAVCKSLQRESSCCRISQADALNWKGNLEAPPDLVFVDPPYELIDRMAGILFGHLAGLLANKPQALVVFEMPGEIALSPTGWECIKRLGKGARQPTVCFFQRTP